MRGRALLSLVCVVAFATYSVAGLTMSYAAQKTSVVEVQPGTMSGKIMDMDEKPLAGKSVKILDAKGKVRYMATTDDKGLYSIEELAAGSYTMIVADTMKVSLVVKPESNNTRVNAMVPTTAKPYAAGLIESSLIVPIVAGVAVIGISAGVIASHDRDARPAPPPVSP